MDNSQTEAGAGDSSAADFRAPTADATAVDSTLEPQAALAPDSADPLADILLHDAPAIEASAQDAAAPPAGGTGDDEGQEPEAAGTPEPAPATAEPSTGQDVNSTAEQNEPVVETQEALSGSDVLKTEVDKRFTQAVQILKDKKVAGVFSADPNKIAMVDLGIAIEQSAGQMPENYHALMQTLSELVQAAQDPAEAEALSVLYLSLGGNMRVLFEGKIHLLSNLVTESASSGSEGIAARAINEGEYKITYDFGRSVVENEVNNKVAELDRTVARLKGRPEAEGYKKQLDMLRLAQQAQGEGGGVVAVRALEMVIDPRNPKDPVRQLLALHGEAVVARSRQAIEAQLRSTGNYEEADIQSIWELARAGDWEGLAKAKDLQNSGLETTIFGKNAEKVVKDLMGPGMMEKFAKKYGVNGILALFLIMTSGFIEFQSALRS